MTNTPKNNYVIWRCFQDKKPIAIKSGLTKQEAIDHCEDPETSSMTAKNACNGRTEKIENIIN